MSRVGGITRLLLGDCFEVLQTLEPDSVDACVTDPPYGLSFMGKHWDKGVPDADVWREVYRVLKPGAHLLSFFGTRTYHRGAVAIEDAGFEIRDQIGWLYGSGFPKSLNISKDIDRQERQRWLKVCKAIDTLDPGTILEAWKENSRAASDAGLSFRSESPEAGPPTPNCDSVPATALLRANPESDDAVAIIAELSSDEVHRISAESSPSAPLNADDSTTGSRGRAASAASSSASLEAMLSMPDSSALQSAWGWQGENTADSLKAAEALKTWLGRKKSSSKADTAALCAALADDLKRITLGQSKIFQSFDTIRQTECASAISVTITESTAASLISFTADTLRRKAIDKAAGAEHLREFSHKNPADRPYTHEAGETSTGWKSPPRPDKTKPHTDAAKQWDGWGTALKPAWESIVVARKPLDGTVANNVLEWGTGGINIDECRVGAPHSYTPRLTHNRNLNDDNWSKVGADAQEVTAAGRFPANVIHDGSDEVMEEFAKYGESKSSGGVNTNGHSGKMRMGRTSGNGANAGGLGDSGSVARYFYCAKASKKERGKDCNHPTVKPLALMRYLVRLVTPPGGLVLDPFAGSGTTLIAAKLEGFRSIGIELDPDYHRMASHRIEIATAQTTLAL